MRVGLIGGGFMGEAVVSALLRESLASPGDVTVSDVAEPRREALASQYGVNVTSDNVQAAQGGEIVVFAVKPQEFEGVASGLKGRLTASQTVVSIMAGVPIARVVEGLGHHAVARAMPNTAAFVGQAMSLWMATDAVSGDSRETVARLLRSLGREIEVSDEKYLDMATALSGSGPGFVFLFLEALIDAGVHIGFRRDVAEELAKQTVFGAMSLARETKQHPAELRNMVTSPAGTTAAGLQVLEEAGLRAAVIDAVEAAYERAKELGG
ncbi:MAG: pyrroline-5-carboxylate reductase [Dehalococcoidia bacterium]